MLAVKQLCTLTIPSTAYSQRISDIQLLPLGLGLAVLTEPLTANAAPHSAVLYRQDGTGPSWRMVGTYSTSQSSASTTQETASCLMSVSEDGSKIVLLSGGETHVLDTQQASLSPILTTSSPSQQQLKGDEPAAAATSVSTQSISPNCCCLCLVSEIPDASPRDATGGCGASSRLHVSVSTLPDLPNVPHAPTVFLGGRSARDGLRPLELPQKMDALRLAWATRRGTHPWDVVQRCLSPSVSGGDSMPTCRQGGLYGLC